MHMDIEPKSTDVSNIKSHLSLCVLCDHHCGLILTILANFKFAFKGTQKENGSILLTLKKGQI